MGREICMFENWNKKVATCLDFLRFLVRGLCFLICFGSIHINPGAENRTMGCKNSNAGTLIIYITLCEPWNGPSRLSREIPTHTMRRLSCRDQEICPGLFRCWVSGGLLTLCSVLSVFHFTISCHSWTCHWAFGCAVLYVYYAEPLLSLAWGTFLP